MSDLSGFVVAFITMVAVLLVLGVLAILRIKLDYGSVEIGGFLFGLSATGFIVWAILDLLYDSMGLGPIWPFSN